MRNTEKENKPREYQKSASASQVPTLLDMVFSTAQLLVVIVGVLIAGLSFFSGATVMMTTIRSGAAVLSLGLLMWLASWLVARGSLESARQQMPESVKAAEAGSERGTSTVEKEA